MEMEGEDGTKLSLNPGVKTVFGRGSGFNTQDPTVSRRHVSLQLKGDKVFFEVLGRNPVWIRVGEKIRTFRKPETGELSSGDRLCVSGHLPVWFSCKTIDFSNIDPVKEFGFLVIGKEFDQYAKSRMRDVKQWEWFLEDFKNGNSDDDDDGDNKGRKGLGKKRSRKKGNEDDDWGVQSDQDKDLMANSKRVVTPNYSTRSKKTKKNTNVTSTSNHAQTKPRGRVDDEDDEDDETLGGFIVTDEEDKLEEDDQLNTDDEEEEEDCDEDEDEVED